MVESYAKILNFVAIDDFFKKNYSQNAVLFFVVTMTVVLMEIYTVIVNCHAVGYTKNKILSTIIVYYGERYKP